MRLRLRDKDVVKNVISVIVLIVIFIKMHNRRGERRVFAAGFVLEMSGFRIVQIHHWQGNVICINRALIRLRTFISLVCRARV